MVDLLKFLTVENLILESSFHDGLPGLLDALDKKVLHVALG